MLILSCKSLNSLSFFLLKMSSFCHIHALARLGACSGPTSSQSYPQLLWATAGFAGLPGRREIEPEPRGR
jgi:hypothetical protein